MSAAPKSPAKKAVKPKKPKAPAAHPPIAQMVTAAIVALKERNGSSLAAIKKYIAANYKCDVAKLAPFIRRFLKKGVADGKLKQIKASYKLDKTKIEKPKKKPVKKEKRAKAAKPKKAKTPKKAPVKTKKPKSDKAKKAKSPKKAVKAKKPRSQSLTNHRRQRLLNQRRLRHPRRSLQLRRQPRSRRALCCFSASSVLFRTTISSK